MACCKAYSEKGNMCSMEVSLVCDDVIKRNCVAFTLGLSLVSSITSVSLTILKYIFWSITVKTLNVNEVTAGFDFQEVINLFLDISCKDDVFIDRA